MSKLPIWFRRTSPFLDPVATQRYQLVKQSLGAIPSVPTAPQSAPRRLATVCEEAKCPNISECWSGGTATVMLLGEVCTRGCRFCAVKTGREGLPVNDFEGQQLVEAIRQWAERGDNALEITEPQTSAKLNYLVLTTVARDDLPDLGSTHIAQAVSEVKAAYPGLLVEALVSDFQGVSEHAKRVACVVDVFAHNIETVERLQRSVRDKRAGYLQSLKVLETAAQYSVTKSSIMLGLGETDDEIKQSFADLLNAGVCILTLGQYLQPSKYHMKVKEFITPEQFAQWKSLGESMGFARVVSGPLVRSSYRAADLADLVKGLQLKIK